MLWTSSNTSVCCLQKRSRVRLAYAWKELWSALIALAKFVASNESSLVKKMNIFAIGHQVCAGNG